MTIWERTLRVGLGGLVAVAFAEPAAAVTITFDDGAAPCFFVQTAPLTETYSALGVHFSGPIAGTGGAILNECGNFGVPALSGDNFLAFNHTAAYDSGLLATGMETITFDVLQGTVSLYASGGDAANSFTIGAFNDADVLVASALATAPAGGYALLSVTSAAADIRWIRFATTADVIYVLDDLTFQARSAPEPVTALLLLVGGAAAGGRRFIGRRS